MDEQQRQDLLRRLDRLVQDVDDEEFDVVDGMRSALKNWDLQGPIPYEEDLRARGIDLERTSPLQLAVEEAAPSRALNADELEQLLVSLRERLKTTPAESPQFEQLRAALSAVRNWSKGGLVGPLPHAAELRAWGIDPRTSPAPALSESTPEPPETPVVPNPDAALVSEYKTACSLIAGQPYQAIQRLMTLQGRVQGSLVERVTADLGEARAALHSRTEALLIEARRVQQERHLDIAAQSEAWRAVTTLNPESLEAQEALQRLQARVRLEIEDQMSQLDQDARIAASRDNLPFLNTARSQIEALVARNDFPQDLAEKAQALAETVKELLADTRGRLGVASTSMVQGDLRESYRLAHESLEGNVPELVDAGGVLGVADREVKTLDFFNAVSTAFLKATREKVADRLSGARATKSSAPNAALASLEEARGWLTDKIWTPDHRKALNLQLEEVEQEIEDVKRLLTDYALARDLVIRSGEIGLRAQERLRLRNEAQQRYPNYPNIKESLDDARENLAGELAGEVVAQIAEAQRLTHAEQFSEALKTLREVRAAALRDVPAPKAGSPLGLALERVAQEESAVVAAENAFRNLEQLLGRVDTKLQAYIADRKNLGLLNDARALLDQVPEAQRQHPKTQVMRARVANEQGEAENYDTGKKAYDRSDWASACDYFDKVTQEYAHYAEARQLRNRASAVLTAAEAEKAEAEKRWKDALEHYQDAVHLFGEVGEDGRTAAVAAKCRAAKDHIEKTDQRFRAPLERARELLTQAQRSVRSSQALLRDRLDPIPQFKEIIATLGPLTEEPSALSEDIKTTLSAARKAWRDAFLPVFEAVLADTNAGDELLNLACQRATELKTTGLLYDKKEEQLRERLQAKKLDQAYMQLRAAEVPNWAALEANRRERLQLRTIEKQPEHQRQWDEAHKKRLEAEIQAQREGEGVKAAQRFLGEQVRTGKVPAEMHWLRLWLELCWEAGDWPEAQSVAQRLADLESDLPVRRARAAFWKSVNGAAQAYAEDDIAAAQSSIEAAGKQVNDSLLEEIETLLEEQTYQRLIAKAAVDRHALAQSGDKATPEQHFNVARAYGLALQLKPKDPVAIQGLAAISSRIEPILQQRCQEVKDLRVSRQDLALACKAADQLLSDLNALETIVKHLQLSDDAKSELEAALERQKKRKARWDSAAAGLKHFEYLVTECKGYPEAPYLDDLQYSGGWDFAPARNVLNPLRAEASKDRDPELLELVDTHLRRLEGYEKSAEQLMEKVRVLLQAVLDEQFEMVVAAANDLESLWKQVTRQDSAWARLEVVIRYWYQYPAVHEIQRVREHHDHALKQQANLQAWEQYEKEVSAAFESLLTASEDLMDDLETLKDRYALRDIHAQCMVWEKSCDSFLKKLEQQQPQDSPMSTRAVAAQSKANVESRKTQLNGAGGRRAQIAQLRLAVEEAQAAFEPALVRFRGFFNGLPSKVKNGRQDPRPQDTTLARELYKACCVYDPKNGDLARLRKQLEDLKITF